MTRQDNHTATGPPGFSGDAAVRLRLKPDAAKTGYVDGAWWPHSDDLAAELPELVAMVATRLGSVRRVTYRLGEWAKKPSAPVIAGRAIQLDGHRRGTVNTIELLSARDRRIVLLVIPPYTDTDHAFAAMVSASATNDTSTVDELLMISPGQRADRTERAAAVRRWNSDAADLTSRIEGSS